MEDGAGLGVCRAQNDLEERGKGDEFRGQGKRRKLLSWGWEGKVGVRNDSAEMRLLV